MSQQKILLINPPQRTEIRRVLGLKAPPMGLLYVASYLERTGLSVEVLDADLYDLSMYEIAEEASTRSPDIVGVTATTDIMKSASRVVGNLRALLPNSVIVAGGAHPTFMPEQTLLDCPGLDLVVRGEGEQTMLELTRALRDFQWSDNLRISHRFTSEKGHDFAKRVSSIRGIAYRSPGNGRAVVLTPERPLIESLDSIPPPARHLVPLERYKLLGKDAALGLVMTSRGCPFGCMYCSSSRIVGKRYRTRSPENILQEIQFLCDKYHLNHVELIDDIFTLNQKRAIEFSELMRTRKMDIRWVASSRVDTISRETMKAMKRAGLEILYFGVESGSQRILNLMNKGSTIEQVQTVFKLARKLGVAPAGSFILGYPGETLEEMLQTIMFSLKLNPEYAQYCVLTPYPGTPVYDQLKAKGLLMTEDWNRYSTLEPVIKYEAFGYSGRTVSRMLRAAYLLFYLRPSYLVRHRHLIPTVIRSGITSGPPN